MAAADKRAKLLSDLLAAKGAAAGDAGRAAEAERASAVIPIAKRRVSEDRESEAPAAPGVLYSKGAATASTFRPSYWSFDHEQRAEPNAAPVKTEPASPPAAAAPIAHPPKSRPLPINFVVAFGCVALFVSTTLFVLSQQHRAEVPAAPQTPSTVAVAPAPVPAAPVAPLPPTVPAGPVALAPAPAPAPTPAASTAEPSSEPAAPIAVLAPTPTPAISQPPAAAVAPPATSVVSEPPSAASEPTPAAEPAAKAPVSAEPAPVVASAPASNSAPAVDTQQADALLARGDDLLATGDVAAARLFYQRAAELGSAAAATAVGQTYDPGVLELLRVRGVRGDMQMAAEWYRKAIAAGDRQAEIRLKRLLARTPG